MKLSEDQVIEAVRRIEALLRSGEVSDISFSRPAVELHSIGPYREFTPGPQTTITIVINHEMNSCENS